MTNYERISKALNVFIDAMRIYVPALLTSRFPNDPWEEIFFAELNSSQKFQWNSAARSGTKPQQRVDYGNLPALTGAKKFRDIMADEFGGDARSVRQLGTDLELLRDKRNKSMHFNDVTDDDVAEALTSMKRVARLLKMTELVAALEKVQKADDSNVAIGNGNVATRGSVAIGNGNVAGTRQDELNFGGEGVTPIKPWFENCEPSCDIEAGTLDEAIFAANLGEVALGVGSEVYSNPALFFQKTYATEGLRDIVGRVVRALNGNEETENRVMQLQTGFGGGKTHALISVFHIAKRGRRLVNEVSSARGIFSEGVVPNFDEARVAVFTNNTIDVVSGREVEGEGFTIRTLWGEIAYQLGGRAAYEKIRGNDEARVAPTATAFKEVLQDAGPALILIDELADYGVKAAGVIVGAGTLFQQTVSFVQSLTEAVAAVPRCVLLVTLPASRTEVADEEIGGIVLDALSSRLSRIATSVRPVDDDDIFEVVRRRLFEKIFSKSVVDSVASRYRSYYQRVKNEVPERCSRPDYAQLIQKSYPFHPELIEIFRSRWGGDSRFQRTRGVLRLLASIVQDLWRRRESLPLPQLLILPSDVSPGNLPALTGTVVHLMGTNWNTVMTTDVYGATSTALELDARGGKNSRLVQGIASAILLASVGGGRRGVTRRELAVCVARPRPCSYSMPDVLNRLQSLEEIAQYLHRAEEGVEPLYRFEARPNINVLLGNARANLTTDATVAEIVRRFNAAKRSGLFGLKLLVVPSDNDVPEQTEPTLVVMSPAFGAKATSLPKDTEEVIKKIALYCGNSSPRVHRNTLLFLVRVGGDADRRDLYKKINEALACETVLRDGKIDDDQRKGLEVCKKEAEQAAAMALVNAYDAVVKYRAIGGAELLEVQRFAGTDLVTQLGANVVQELVEAEWLLKGSIGVPLLSRHNLLPEPGRAVSAKEIYDAFINFDDKPMILGPDVVAKAVSDGCEKGAFNVAVGSAPTPEEAQIYFNQRVPDMSGERVLSGNDVWLVDKSVMPPKPSEPKPMTTGTGGTAGTPGGGGATETGRDATAPSEMSGGTTSTGTKPPVKRVTIRGSVAVENYSQLFTSFIGPLKNNGVRIEVKISGSARQASSLDENTKLFRLLKESAEQLGLSIEVER